MKALLLLFGASALLAQPPLFFREDWKQTPAETPVTQAHVANPGLLLATYGPGKAGIKKSHHDPIPNDPWYIWSGTTTGNWALTLRHKSAMVDLTGQAKIRWVAKQSGFRQLRVVLKLASGAWLVSDQSDDASSDWREKQFTVADLRWRKLDIQTVTESAWVDKPDLKTVDEIGFTDLMQGGQSSACSRLDWIEVYGVPVKR